MRTGRRSDRASRAEDPERDADGRRQARRDRDEGEVLPRERRELGGVRSARSSRRAALRGEKRARLRMIRLTEGVRLFEHGRACPRRRGRSSCRSRRPREVVRDENERRAEALDQTNELALELDARNRIERAEWLIDQDERRLRGERASDADALPLSTGELVRKATAERVGVEADETEELTHPRARLLFGPALRDAARGRRSRRYRNGEAGRFPE